MQEDLKKIYFRFLTPAVAGFLFVFADRTFGLFGFADRRVNEIVVVAVFIASLGCALALPIFLRSLFAHRHKDSKNVAESDFVQFESRLIRVALATPYLSLLAYLFNFPEFYLAASFLASLYAVYYFYPSRRRIDFEKRIFRVN